MEKFTNQEHFHSQHVQETARNYMWQSGVIVAKSSRRLSQKGKGKVDPEESGWPL